MLEKYQLNQHLNIRAHEVEEKTNCVPYASRDTPVTQSGTFF
jgi:hypothetical protein